MDVSLAFAPFLPLSSQCGLIWTHSYPLYVNIWKRDVMDAHRETKVGIEPSAANDKALQLEAQATEVESRSAEVAPGAEEVSK